MTNVQAFQDQNFDVRVGCRIVQVSRVGICPFCYTNSFKKKKLLIFQTEVAISPGSKGIVHHLNVFYCEVPSGETVRPYDAPCGNNAQRPKGLTNCMKVIGAWALGADVSTILFTREAGDCNMPVQRLSQSLYMKLSKGVTDVTIVAR